MLPLLAALLLLPAQFGAAGITYEPTWESLDARPIPDWFDDVKFGIFIHWGVFSVPSFGSEWFWWYWQEKKSEAYVTFMSKNYPPDFTYQDFGPQFTAEFYDPQKWANIFKDSGAKYIVLTSKHHEGYTLWGSNFSWNWNALDMGSKRDLVDGDANASYTYWNSTGFLAWLYNESPVKDIVVTNDRWGSDCMCKHGDFYTCKDRYNPGHLVLHKWENCMTIDEKSWGYRRDASLSELMTIEELVQELVETVSCGGNLLMNIGPTHDGRIPVVFEERLKQMGTWLKVNGEAIYSTKPWRAQNDSVTPGVWYTCRPKEQSVYAIFLKWPTNWNISLGEPKPYVGKTEVQLIGFEEKLTWSPLENEGMIVSLPTLSPSQMTAPWGWTLKITNLKEAVLSPRT
ncbi:plasma alpha-L-fucosidase-like isoform X4 [Dendropsophus ebraccatus]|uniref:plasma alpha-L-fucosidase-like isoform X4 n=1 Tax=Dendropsophus ebraccatus TaxID=150705 RepID=UPI0038320CA7